MRRHIVRPFVIMAIVRVVFGYRFIEIGFEIHTHSGIGIFIDGKRSGSVLDEYLAYPRLPMYDRRKTILNLRGNQVEPPGLCMQCNLFLKDFHDSAR